MARRGARPLPTGSGNHFMVGGGGVALALIGVAKLRLGEEGLPFRICGMWRRAELWDGEAGRLRLPNGVEQHLMGEAGGADLAERGDEAGLGLSGHRRLGEDDDAGA